MFGVAAAVSPRSNLVQLWPGSKKCGRCCRACNIADLVGPVMGLCRDRNNCCRAAEMRRIAMAMGTMLIARSSAARSLIRVRGVSAMCELRRHEKGRAGVGLWREDQGRYEHGASRKRASVNSVDRGRSLPRRLQRARIGSQAAKIIIASPPPIRADAWPGFAIRQQFERTVIAFAGAP